MRSIGRVRGSRNRVKRTDGGISGAPFMTMHNDVDCRSSLAILASRTWKENVDL